MNRTAPSVNGVVTGFLFLNAGTWEEPVLALTCTYAASSIATAVTAGMAFSFLLHKLLTIVFLLFGHFFLIWGGLQFPRQSIGLCFFGLTRSLRITYPSIKENLLTPLEQQGFIVETLLHTYNQSLVSNARSRETNVQLNTSEWMLLNPVDKIIDHPWQADEKYNFQIFASYGNPWKSDTARTSIKNVLRAQFSIERCLEVVQRRIQAGALYNLIMFSRPDVMYSRRHPLPNLNLLHLNDQNVASVFVDRFVVGKLSPIRIWASRMQSAIDFLHPNTWDPELSKILQKNPVWRKGRQGLHAENLLTYHLTKHNIQVIHLSNFCFNRVRANLRVQIDCQ